MSLGKFSMGTDAAGWAQGRDGAVVGPHGARARVHQGGDGLPDAELLCIQGEVAGQGADGAAVGYAFAVSSVIADTYAYDLGDVTRLALHGPEAIASGAVRPWLDRVRAKAAVWMRDADGAWLPLGGGSGRAKVAVPDVPVKTRTNALIAELVRQPAAVAVEGAASTVAALTAAGWTSSPLKDTSRSGLRVLGSATLLAANGARHRVEYLLTGEPTVPEALLWRYDVTRAVPPSADPGAGELIPARREFPAQGALLIDVLGAVDPALPASGVRDRPHPLDATLALIVREAPILDADALSRLHLALATITSVWKFFSGKQQDRERVVFIERLGDGFPDRGAPALSAALAALHAEPASAARWLTMGHAAYEEGLRGVAVAAYTRAAELGTGDGVPLLWRGWLRRAVDMDGALADLDRAAAAGGVVGPARHLQAEVFRQVARDPEATLAALARTTEEAPEDAEGWLSRGLRLAKYGRPAEAVEVLDRAVELHGGGKTAYYLGYARLLTGDRIGALTALEDAVRELPGLADTIVADPDLEALRGEPRFDGLPKLAANREAAHHRRVREAVRPSDPEARAGSETDAGGVGDRATDLGSVAEVHEVFRRKVDGIRKARSEAVTHEATRAFLADIGLPREAGEFRLDSTFDNIYGEALRAYELGGWRSRLTGDRIPDGLGGLLILGTLGDGADAALDGGTGEVYRVAEDFSLTWLAPSLESFFLPRCLPDDAWVWRLTPDTVHRLDGPDVARIAPGRLSLVGDGLTPADFARLTGFLREHGALVGYLRLDRNRSLDHDLTAVDLAEHCPNLRELWLRGGTVTTSVFTHPALERLHLTESTCRATEPEIRLDGDSRLHSVSLDDCLVHADSLYVGPRSPMRRFSSLIDEDYGFVFPERLEFDNCPDLYGITLDMDAGTWTLTLRGSLPKLREVRQDARPYGSFTYRIATANPADKKAYQSLIRKGARYARKD